jgi:hypothetical protein
MDGECIRPADEDSPLNFSHDKYRKVVNDIGSRLLGPASLLPWRDEFFSKTARHGVAAMPLQNSIIAVKEAFPVFETGPQFLDTFLNKLGELPLDVRQSFTFDFLAAADTLPLLIKYCSLSGHYCRVPKELLTSSPCNP